MVSNNKVRLLAASFLCLLLGVCCATFAFGQGAVTTGTISGTVLDKTGAVIPGATVAVKNSGTGQVRKATTDSNGVFLVPQLPAASYEVSVEAKGFKKASVSGIGLDIGAERNLRFGLEVGEVTQTVEVSVEAVAGVETTKSEVSSVIQEAQVRELPLNQRSFTALVVQQPGLVQLTNTSGNSNQTPTSVAFAQGSQISANGQVSQSLAYLVDGININNSGFGAPGTAAGGDIPGVEAIQEFKVLSQNYSAAYGGSAGAVVSFAQRSGTNNLHGSVYEYLRNDKFDSASFFDNYNGLGKPPFRRNQFGVTLGGPVRKDKSFFFINYEGLRSSLTTSATGTVPTECARNGGTTGNTTGCPQGQLQPFQVLGPDPANCPNPTNPGACTYIPVAITSGVKAVLDLYPLPNGTDFGNGIAQYNFLNHQPVHQDFGLIKFDQVLTSKDNLTGKYQIINADGNNAYFLPIYVFNKASRLQTAQIKWTRVISNSLVNTFSIGGNRSYTTAATAPTVTIPPEAYTGNPARQVLGTISVGSATSGNTSGSVSTIGLDNWGPFRGVHNTIPVTDDLTYTRGNHTFRFGGQFVPHQWNWDKGNLIGGGWTFNSLNDLLAGNPAVLIIRSDEASPHWKFRTKSLAWYVEDAWKLRPNLTVTMGLRHEFQVPILEETSNKLGNSRTRDEANPHVGAPFHNYSLKQFSPRIGIAWDPFNDHKTAIRTGFGLFHDFIPLEAFAGELSYNDPLPTLNTFFGAPNAPAFLPQISFPDCNGCTPRTGYYGLLTGVLEPVRSPTSAQWNLQFERELPGQIQFSATYTGSQTWNIMRGIEGNSSVPCDPATVTFPANPGGSQSPYFGPAAGTCGTAAPGIASTAFTLYAVTFDAHSNYHAGTFALNKRFTQGFSFNTSFTWAKAISESDTNNSGAILLGNASHSMDPLNRHADRSEALISFRKRFTANMIYELPFGKGKKYMNSGGVADVILGGWALNLLGEARSGFPFSVLAGFGITNTGDNLTFPDRPNISRKNPVLGSVTKYYDPAAYSLQTPGYYGTAPRNSVVGPGYTSFDFGLGKRFRLTERINLQFRAEFFNIANHPNFDIPFNQLYTPSPTVVPGTGAACNLSPAQEASLSCNPQAGRITSTVGTPRQVQFALKLTF